MKTNLIISLLIIFLFGCKEKKEEMILLSSTLVENVEKLQREFNEKELTLENLNSLKEVSDKNLKLFQNLDSMKINKITHLRVRKYIEKNFEIEKLCSTRFLSEDFVNTITPHCTLGYFNVCPNNFSNYNSVKTEVFKKLKIILGEEFYKKTDCL